MAKLSDIDVLLLSEADVSQKLNSLTQGAPVRLHWMPLTHVLEHQLATGNDYNFPQQDFEKHQQNPWIILLPSHNTLGEEGTVNLLQQIINHHGRATLLLQRLSLCENLMVLYDGSPEAKDSLQQFTSLFPNQSQGKEVTVLSTENFGKKKIKEEKLFLAMIRHKFPNMAYIKIPGTTESIHLQHWLKRGSYCLIISRQLAKELLHTYHINPDARDIFQSFGSLFIA
ncbi:hypothetical protein QWY31_03550 [Cytophagales bacterium LB-30]|uniref:Tetrapyrrole biosynthesis uroporphyrinogen III synthase domain-containing protein n=1 Tax=Shiella aurantiaca TaxID=3058365 RepID=A0ABT8F293_9BACT|nr:hypothetical protein [Shiella aurantiaca]MDN4164560.1 hypothetical protein [Shiella aurantiaca]